MSSPGAGGWSPTGTATWSGSWPWSGTDPSVYLLRSLAVAPEQRGTGVGAALVRVALAAADAHEQGRAGVGLLTETAAGYFDRFGFTAADRADLPAALSASPELTGACPATATAYWRA